MGPVQGEDVSMGIWMAAIGPKRYQVSKPERGWPLGSEEFSEVSLSNLGQNSEWKVFWHHHCALDLIHNNLPRSHTIFF